MLLSTKNEMLQIIKEDDRPCHLTVPSECSTVPRSRQRSSFIVKHSIRKKKAQRMLSKVVIIYLAFLFFWYQLCCTVNVPSFCTFSSVNSQKQNHFWRNSTCLRELQCIDKVSKWIYFRPREETLCYATECLIFIWRNIFLIIMQMAIKLLDPKDYKHINAKWDTVFVICPCRFLFNFFFFNLCWVMGRCYTMPVETKHIPDIY